MKGESRSAVFSDDRRYRYTLKIVWDDAVPLVQFISLNPSTADENSDDPTLRRVKAFARSWGMGGVVMTNLFAYRSTDPRALYSVADPIGEPGGYIRGQMFCFSNRNDMLLFATAERCAKHVAAWGNHGNYQYRSVKVRKIIPHPLECLGVTASGEPRHPLYVPAKTALQPFIKT